MTQPSSDYPYDMILPTDFQRIMYEMIFYFPASIYLQDTGPHRALVFAAMFEPLDG